MNTLELKNISVTTKDAEIVHEVSLTIKTGRVLVLMGPNGSGKSSLVNSVMGHPRYTISGGRIFLDSEDITLLPTHEKAKKGIFLSLQNPPALPGVTVSSFLRNAVSAVTGSKPAVLEFQKELEHHMRKLGIAPELSRRHVNEGFSGGEKKQLEALQLVLLRPKFALLDETDAGLDSDALRFIAETIQSLAPEMGILIITHTTRILKFLIPDEVCVMKEGRLAQSGGKELAERIEKHGYAK
jgi:Fe-S cluster assembly ATP-binding protein